MALSLANNYVETVRMLVDYATNIKKSHLLAQKIFAHLNLKEM